MANEYRISWSAVEVSTYGAPLARSTWSGTEGYHVGAPSIRITWSGLETLHGGAPSPRITGTFLEVFRSVKDAPRPIFPVRLFCPPSLKAAIVGAAESGGVALSGEAAMEALAHGGRWVMEFGEAALWTREKVIAWRRFLAGADLGVMPVTVPLWDRRHQPFADPELTTPLDFGLDVWGDEVNWSEDQCHAALTVAGAAQADQVTFSYTGDERPVGGEHFSLYGSRYAWRLYRLVRIISDVAGVITAEIRPPLREYARSGTPLNFDSPRCTMRPDGDIEAAVEMLRFGKGVARFVETFARYP